jgi:nitroreductase
MKLAEVIRSRRSVSVFTDQPVDQGLVLELLETAVWAPNHHVTEPWRFVYLSGDSVAQYAAIRRDMALDVCALEDEGARRQVGDGTYKKFVCVPAYLAIIMKDDPDPETQEEDYAAAAALTQNFLLLAWERGLGTLWKTFKNDRRLRELLSLADDERVVGWIHLGYPSGATAPTRRTPASERFIVLDPTPLKAEG